MTRHRLLRVSLLIAGALAIVVAMVFTAFPSLRLVWGTLIFGLLTSFIIQLDRDRIQLDHLHRLQAAYDQLDQQTKLIIRTDLELHRIQEELDRRLASLMSLHALGQQLRVNARSEEVFGKLNPAIVTNFGFSKGLLGMCPSSTTIEWRSLVGLTAPVAEGLRTHLMNSQLLQHLLTDPTPLAVSTTSAPSAASQQLLELLGVTTVVIAGIVPETGPSGCLLLGRAGSSSLTSRADQELVAILTNQLAIAVENSALYEESWAARRDLERKVGERTHELADANTQLIRLNKAKSEFVSAVSHELRTPLAAIKGYASLLRAGQFGPLTPAQGERMAKIEKHTDWLTNLINNLLDIARIESGRITMEHRMIPVGEFFSTLHDLIRPQLEAQQLHYEVDVGAVPHLAGDPQHLQRMALNLLSNAVKYTPAGGMIAVTLQPHDGAVWLTVRDTGHGIAPEELPNLFREFYRSPDPINHQIPGTGLGLVLVKRIVEAHGGTIDLTSALDNGTTVTVKLPAS